MDANALMALAGFALSLLFGYVPGFKDWYGALDTVSKRAVMAGILLVLAITVAILSCTAILNAIVCDRPGVLALVNAFILALGIGLGVNQGTYMLLVRKSGPDTDIAVPVQPVPEK